MVVGRPALEPARHAINARSTQAAPAAPVPLHRGHRRRSQLLRRSFNAAAPGVPAVARPAEPLTSGHDHAAEQLLGEQAEPHQQEAVPKDVLREFEHRLEADLQSVAVTLTAVTGVIIFWRGVWSLLDALLGESMFGAVCCIFVGLTIVLWIRLSGIKVASSFWPPS